MKKPVNLLVLDMMDKHAGTYTNPHGMELTMNKDMCMRVHHGWKGDPVKENMEFGLYYRPQPLHVFLEDFCICSLRDIEMLKYTYLWALFVQEKVEIYCAVDMHIIYFPMYFRYSRNRTYARDEDGLEHQVPGLPICPGDFIRYTQKLFQFS